MPIACTIRDCPKPITCRGWCWTHYNRWRVYGDPLIKTRGNDRTMKFWSTFRRDPSGCWLWTGAVNPQGYGFFYTGSDQVMAHRWAYATMIEPVLDGVDVHHVCEVRACVNPTHLQPIPAVTHRFEHNRQHRPLDDETVRSIRARLAATANVLGTAKHFGVSRDQVRGIAEGRTYCDIT